MQDSPKNILVVNIIYYTGGVETSLMGLSKKLIESNLRLKQQDQHR